MTDFISIIIPNYNGAATLQQCLQAATSSHYTDFEIIVVDDGSIDHSVDMIRQFPCQLIQLKQHCGAATARNIGAAHSKGNILFFTDADCLLMSDTLDIAQQALRVAGAQTVLGGTYTHIPFDKRFFSLFQSIFIHHSETRHPTNPDYIATHAMAIDARVFQENSGFDEQHLPILEDVEFSHRLKRHGYRLNMEPKLQVQHIFNFSLAGSLRNAVKKSMYWTLYSIHHGDLLQDSGTASLALKINVVSWFLTALLLAGLLLTGSLGLWLTIALLLAVNVTASHDLLRAFYRVGGAVFGAGATAYYLFVYPVAVGTGALLGTAKYIRAWFDRRITA